MVNDTSRQAIDALLLEERRYPPPPQLAKEANAQPGIYERDLAEFWAAEARERVTWSTPFDQVCEWDPPYAKWFLGGRLNACYNCVDRHVAAGLGDKVAFYWEGEPDDDRRALTFADLQTEVVRFANALKLLGVGKDTPVGIYMGMVAELPVAMLACARLGAPHTVVFGGFSAESLAARLRDMECKVLVTQDGGWRRGNVVPLKANADQALADAPTVGSVVVLRRSGTDVAMQAGRDHWWHELVADQPGDPASCPCEEMDAEDLLYLLYSSGTTAMPKAIVHTTAGYLVGVASTHHYVFDVKPDTVYWCAADIGWVTGHSYIVYGPLCNGTTGVLYEGTPDHPDKDRWWSIVERYRVTVLYTAPTAIRAHMKWGPEYAAKHDLSSLRLLGTVGEPINPGAWVWYQQHIGGGRTPVVDTWWQTETGMIMITPLPGLTTLKPGSATRPFPGVDAAVYDDQGSELGPGEGGGYLVLRRPWRPCCAGSTTTTIATSRPTGRGSPASTSPATGPSGTPTVTSGCSAGSTTSSTWPRTGSRPSRWRARWSTIRASPRRPCAAAPDPVTGQAIVAYVSLRGGDDGSPAMLEELRGHVARKIGKIAMPASIVFTPELPKTRSGKIMRRLLRDVAEQRTLGDTTTLADPTVVEEIQRRASTEAAEDEG